MPLPLIPIAIGAAVLSALGIGTKKGFDGVSAMKDAKRIGKQAEQRHRHHVALFEKTKGRLGGRLARYYEQRQAVINETFGRLFALLERLDQKARLTALESLGSLGIGREEVRRFAAQYVEAGGTLKGSFVAGVAGAGASGVATSAVGAFATTAGGTAMSGLSGAALNSAVMAWLGGGSLAAGGWGMAAGTVVLGGIAVGPAVAVAGFVLAAQGERARTKAVEYASEVEKKVAQLVAGRGLLEQAERRVNELSEVIERVDLRARGAIERLGEVADAFDSERDEHLARFATAMQLAKALSELVRAQIFNDAGDLESQTELLLARQRQLLGEVAA